MAADDKILLRRYHEDGDLAAREELIERYMSLVRSPAGTPIAESSSTIWSRSAPSA
jgi:DNA-directed RNA polymerase specialized sigma subunit